MWRWTRKLELRSAHPAPTTPVPKHFAPSEVRVPVPRKYSAPTVSRSRVVGILTLDYKYVPVIGDVDHSCTFGYKTQSVQVQGLTFERAQRGAWDDNLRQAFLDAIAELHATGSLVGITGNCGFMMHYQSRLRELTRTPVYMSSLIQAPLVEAAFSRSSRILVLTANANSLLSARSVLLQESGVKVDESRRFVVQGIDTIAGFEPISKPSLGPINIMVTTAALVKVCRERCFRDTSIAAILLECTELPHYTDALREATSLPVFSAITMIDFFYAAGSKTIWSHTVAHAQATEEQALVAGRETASELPPARDANRDLREDAHQRVKTSCEATLLAVRCLVAETLTDELEAEVNDVRGSNVIDSVWARLRLLDRVVPMLKEQTTTETVNEVALAGLNIHVTDLWKHYLPLANSLYDRYLAFRRAQTADAEPLAFCVGINAPPGCGKSTLVQLLRVLLRAAAEGEKVSSLAIEHVSSDDLCWTNGIRTHARALQTRAVSSTPR